MYQMLFVWSFILPSLGFTFHLMSHNVQKGLLVRQCFHIYRKFCVFFRVACEPFFSSVESIYQDLSLPCHPLLLPTVLQTKIMTQ